MRLLNLYWLDDPQPPLSPRQEEIVQHLARAKWPREIAAALRISIKTVETHCSSIQRKWRLRNRPHLYQEARSYVARRKDDPC